MSYKNIRPEILIPPCKHIKEELEVREWTHQEFADMLKIEPTMLSNIINNNQSITPEIAGLIGKVFGTSADVWINLEHNYRQRLQ